MGYNIRDSQILYVCKKITGETLHEEIYREFNESVRKNLVYDKYYVYGLSVETRIKLFKKIVKKHYPSIATEQINEFCDLQKKLFKKAEKYGLASQENAEIPQSITYAEKDRLIAEEKTGKASKGEVEAKALKNAEKRKSIISSKIKKEMGENKTKIQAQSKKEKTKHKK
jgi:hypothetical protein